SQRYAVFYLSPYLLDLNGLMRQGRTTMQALSWQPGQDSRLLWIERESGALAGTAPGGQRHCLHLINAFDDEGKLTIDVLQFVSRVYDQYQELPDLFQDVPAGNPVRFVVDPASGSLLERQDLPYANAPDFPTVAAQDEGRPYRDCWMLGISATGQKGRKFYDQ